MSPSHFIRRVAARPQRRWSAARDRHALSTSFIHHRVALRPARFRLELSGQPNWEEPEVLAHARGAMMRRAFYVGRVTEVAEEGVGMLVNLWEIPSGRAMIAWLDPEQRPDAHHIEGTPAAVGDQIFLWTWVELPGHGTVEDRYHGRLERRVLSEQERAELKKIVEVRRSLANEGER